MTGAVVVPYNPAEDWPDADLSLDTTDRPIAELVDRIDDCLARPDVSPAEA